MKIFKMDNKASVFIDHITNTYKLEFTKNRNENNQWRIKIELY